jgi:hypothetical protein
MVTTSPAQACMPGLAGSGGGEMPEKSVGKATDAV